MQNKLQTIANKRTHLSIHRSNKNISIQLIDNVHGITLTTTSTLEKNLSYISKNNIKTAAKVGTIITEHAKAARVKNVYFDRNDFLFHKKIKTLANATHKNSLKF